MESVIHKDSLSFYCCPSSEELTSVSAYVAKKWAADSELFIEPRSCLMIQSNAPYIHFMFMGG